MELTDHLASEVEELLNENSIEYDSAVKQVFSKYDRFHFMKIEKEKKKVIDICTELGILEFIEQLPQGFNTYLGENGASLSGGQKQRIAIARAMYKTPSIIIMDEATSSLDSVSEEFVQNTIHRLRDEGKTIILIAHRLSTVINADKIVVLEKGKLIEEGNHDALFKSKGKYYDMWKKQLPKF